MPASRRRVIIAVGGRAPPARALRPRAPARRNAPRRAASGAARASIWRTYSGSPPARPSPHLVAHRGAERSTGRAASPTNAVYHRGPGVAPVAPQQRCAACRHAADALKLHRAPASAGGARARPQPMGRAATAAIAERRRRRPPADPRSTSVARNAPPPRQVRRIAIPSPPYRAFVAGPRSRPALGGVARQEAADEIELGGRDGGRPRGVAGRWVRCHPQDTTAPDAANGGAMCSHGPTSRRSRCSVVSL